MSRLHGPARDWPLFTCRDCETAGLARLKGRQEEMRNFSGAARTGQLDRVRRNLSQFIRALNVSVVGVIRHSRTQPVVEGSPMHKKSRIVLRCKYGSIQTTARRDVRRFVHARRSTRFQICDGANCMAGSRCYAGPGPNRNFRKASGSFERMSDRRRASHGSVVNAVSDRAVLPTINWPSRDGELAEKVGRGDEKQELD